MRAEEKTELETIVEGATVQEVTLRLKPQRLPKVSVTDERGVVREKVVGLADLLQMLDRSSVLEALRQEAIRTVALPQLPPLTMFVGVVEAVHFRDVVVTGHLPPREQPFVLARDGTRSVHVVPLPAVAWRARWREGERRLVDLRLAVVPGDREVGPETQLYRYPFSNVYGWDRGRVCWPTQGKPSMDLHDVVRLGVEAFFAVENNADLYGVGNSQNSPYREYPEFLKACEGGIRHEWLIPMETTMRALHEGG